MNHDNLGDELAFQFAFYLDEAIMFHELDAQDMLRQMFDEAENLISKRTINRDIAIAYSFFDGWIDAMNHNWMYYEGISKDDWPVFSSEISGELKTGSEITNEIVLKHFNQGK